GTPHRLLATDLDLVAARAGEAERRRRALRLRHGHDLGSGAERAKPAEQGDGDPAIRLQQVTGAAQVGAVSEHAVGQLTLPAIVVDRAAAGRPPHEPHTEATARRHVHALVEWLTVAERDRGRGPREEAKGRR